MRTPPHQPGDLARGAALQFEPRELRVAKCACGMSEQTRNPHWKCCRACQKLRNKQAVLRYQARKKAEAK